MDELLTWDELLTRGDELLTCLLARFSLDAAGLMVAEEGDSFLFGIRPSLNDLDFLFGLLRCLPMAVVESLIAISVLRNYNMVF